MIRKTKQWLKRFSWKAGYDEGIADTHEMMSTTRLHPNHYTQEQFDNGMAIAYNDGKRDGLAIARQQATRSLQAILKEQNNKV